MSQVYSMEPRTSGKVNLNTTHGQLSIELWSKECPLACRNFIQLCLEGYYDQSPFHRLVPGFCLQGGKSGYEASEDEEGHAVFPGGRFAIETHSRLKFSRRGLLGMVALDASSQPNGSQFFFTLSESPELNGKATLFGRLVGDTIFNLLRMGELETDPKTEAPLYPPKIISTEVVSNPFDDIVVREKERKASKAEDKEIVTKDSALKKKNVSLLSFVEEGEDEPVRRNIPKKESDEPKQQQQAQQKQEENPKPASSSLQFLQQMKSIQMRETQDKIKKMEEELGFRPASSSSDKQEIPVVEEKKNLSALEKYKAKFAEKKRKPEELESKDEMGTLLLLNSFRLKIKRSEDSTPVSTEQSAEKKHMDICKLHGLLNCLSCRDTFNINLNDDDLDEKDWMMHKLVFDRRELEGKVRDDLRDLVVIDPREQAEKANKNSNKK